jgi:oligopeptide transport system substrate-binding protein
MKKLLITLLMITIAFAAFAGGDKEEAAPMADPVVFSFNNSTELQSLDPGHIEGVPEHRIYMALFEGLVTYDPETLDPIPGLAESWKVSDDGLTWTFNLRKSNWSDGTPITAQTVVDSWLRFLSPDLGAVYAYLPGMIIKGAAEYNSGDSGADTVGIRALDDYTFQFELTGPAPYALGMLTHYAFAVVPMHIIETYGDKWTMPENFVSNGPYNLTSWEPHEKIVMEKSSTYWDKDEVKIDKIIAYPIEDENTSLNMYKQGDLDWVLTVPDAQLDSMKLDPTYVTNATFITYYYEFNTT